MITTVQMISILNPLDKGLLWVARMQANLEPKLPSITSQVQKHFIQNPIMCVPTSLNLNKFLERSYCLGQGLLYSQWPMRWHLLWQWQWLGSFSKKWPHDWLSWGSSTPKDLGGLWAVSEAPQSFQLWNCGFIHLLSCGTPLSMASESSTQWGEAVFIHLFYSSLLKFVILFLPPPSRHLVHS